MARAVLEALPDEDIIYFGDTARVPYGDKSAETIKNYALEITDFLLSKGVKMILIACNTVSATAKNEILARAADIPVLDVITAGAHAAFETGSHKNIGVIGTLATVHSGAYARAVQSKNGSANIVQQACPLLVPLAEEGWIDNEVTRQTLDIYLEIFKQNPVDSLILGCTHYPLFKNQITETLDNPEIRIIDSAESIARAAGEKLTALSLLNPRGGHFDCYVSDRPQRFKEVAERFLGRQITGAHIVKL